MHTEDDQDEVAHKITRQILNDDEAMKRIRGKIVKLGRPVLVTFTFAEPHEKKVSIDFDTYRDAMAAGFQTLSQDGDSITAATDMLSGAFTYATVLNTVIKSMEDEQE